MGSLKYTEIYTDGGVYRDTNTCYWAFIIVEKNEVIYKDSGQFSCSGGFDVERAESEAIHRACSSLGESNYVLFTDSKSIIAKLNDNVPNATKNPLITGIKNIIDSYKSITKRGSLSIKWKKRRSDKWMCLVDDLVEKTN